LNEEDDATPTPIIKDNKIIIQFWNLIQASNLEKNNLILPFFLGLTTLCDTLLIHKLSFNMLCVAYF
jgi:hypothetical protein